MQYPFYQRLIELNHMVHVMTLDIPENMTEWHVPLKAPRGIAIFDGTPPPIVHTPTLVYRKTRTQVGDLFVADVKCLVESS